MSEQAVIDGMPGWVASRIEEIRTAPHLVQPRGIWDTARWLANRLEIVERERDTLRELLGQSVRVVHPLAEGTHIQYLGVYVLNWEERDRPTYGFVEWSNGEIDAALAHPYEDEK